MKLKLIKDSEVVVSREEYEKLTSRRPNCEDRCRNMEKSVARGECNYGIEEVGGCLVVYLYDAISFPIKCFSSDDPDYNRVCAEELVELLNQEQ